MFRVIVLLLCGTGAIASKCTLHYQLSSPPILTQKFGSHNIILNARDGQLSWDDRATVNAYCPGGLRNLRQHPNYGYYNPSSSQQVTFSCSSSQVMFDRPDTGVITLFQNDGQLSCPTTSKFYETLVPACEYQGLAYGFLLGKQAVVLAEVCYNLDLLEPMFLHYVAGARSTILESQTAHNVANITSSSVEVFIDNSLRESENRTLLEAVRKSLPQYLGVVQYQIEEFIPLREASGVFGLYVDDFRSVNMIPWWRSLKFGNWKLLEEAIDMVSRNETYDVFAGTSDIVIYPSNDKCMSTDLLTFKVDSYIRNVPKYIWNYVKKREEADDGIVIIGINSPFFDSSKGGDVLCDDVCDNIPWLSSLKRSRKMAALGYIFCCKPADVKNKLDHFLI